MIWALTFLAIIIVPGLTSFLIWMSLGRIAGIGAIVMWIVGAILGAGPLGSFILPRYLAGVCDVDGDCLEIMFAPLLYLITLGLMSLGLVIVSLFVIFENPHRQPRPSRS